MKQFNVTLSPQTINVGCISLKTKEIGCTVPIGGLGSFSQIYAYNSGKSINLAGSNFRPIAALVATKLPAMKLLPSTMALQKSTHFVIKQMNWCNQLVFLCFQFAAGYITLMYADEAPAKPAVSVSVLIVIVTFQSVPNLKFAICSEEPAKTISSAQNIYFGNPIFSSVHTATYVPDAPAPQLTYIFVEVDQ
ncbi:MAG: hypothetical protein EZS28_016455 [Streblomastix strix]|uniref:Uncharacterized protein n=1 Tax=Streblomastix strix TaxID=222440 RepID=A0A5J4W079_9EUKA|nr:MAG: hypothetical protein EZS28_016455 [Streblomastix strix]